MPRFPIEEAQQVTTPAKTADEQDMIRIEIDFHQELLRVYYADGQVIEDVFQAEGGVKHFTTDEDNEDRAEWDLYLAQAKTTAHTNMIANYIKRQAE